MQLQMTPEPENTNNLQVSKQNSANDKVELLQSPKQITQSGRESPRNFIKDISVKNKIE